MKTKLQFKIIFFSILLASYSFKSIAQVGIGNTSPNSNALLDIGTSSSTQGVRLPRVALSSTASFSPLSAHVSGMLVYNTATAGSGGTSVSPGFYYNDGSAWVRLANNDDWKLNGNSGTSAAVNFVGTTDAISLSFRTNNNERIRLTTNGELNLFANGSAATPVLNWNGDTDTGIFRSAANELSFSTGGTNRLQILSDGSIRANSVGTAANPLFAWTGDTNKGFYSPGADMFGLVTNGVERFRIPNSNQVFAMSNGTNASPFYSWNSDPDTGIYRISGNTLGVATSGLERMRFLNDGRVSVNNSSPFGSDWFTVTAATDDYAVNGYSTGAGYGIYGENTGTGAGVQSFNSGTGYGIENQQTGTGNGIYNETANGAGIVNFINSYSTGVYSDLTAAGGTGEFINFDDQDGTGVYVLATDDPAAPTTGGDVYSFFSNANTATATVGTLIQGTIFAGQQFGIGHGYILNHFGDEGRNMEINTMNPNNPDPLLQGISDGDGDVLIMENRNNSLSNAITIGDFSYTGTDANDHIGVSGFSDPTGGANNWGIGVEGVGGYIGVVGYDNSGFGNPFSFGVLSFGDIAATGGKSFVIDHPSDPANKILKHFSIESDEILNIYRGTEVFDSNGNVQVQLPDYYDLINRNASYQLTPVGAAMPNLYISKEIENGVFNISGGVPGKKVSWTLTAERNDPYLQQNPQKRENVVDKGDKRGKYLMPGLFNQPDEKGIIYKKRKTPTVSRLKKNINTKKIGERKKITKKTKK